MAPSRVLYARTQVPSCARRAAPESCPAVPQGRPAVPGVQRVVGGAGRVCVQAGPLPGRRTLWFRPVYRSTPDEPPS